MSQWSIRSFETTLVELGGQRGLDLFRTYKFVEQIRARQQGLSQPATPGTDLDQHFIDRVVAVGKTGGETEPQGQDWGESVITAPGSTFLLRALIRAHVGPLDLIIR